MTSTFELFSKMKNRNYLVNACHAIVLILFLSACAYKSDKENSSGVDDPSHEILLVQNGPQVPVSGRGTPQRGYINAEAYGIKGDGVADDTKALQAAIDETIRKDGFLTIPTPERFYKITKTLNISAVHPDDQFWIDIQGGGPPGFSIIYMGPSGEPAIKIFGMKGGSIRGVKVKIGDGISNSVCWDVGTHENANSTASFTFYDCIVELNKGENNVGWRIGNFVGGGADVSQILWVNPTVWGGGGPKGEGISGQNGFQIDGSNSCQFTWIGGGIAYTNHAFHLNAGGAMYMFGVGGSQNRVDLYTTYSNTFTLAGNRWELGKQHIFVGGGSAHPSFLVSNSVISDYHPDNGRLFDIGMPGTLVLDAVKIECGDCEFGSEMIFLESEAMGSLHVRGGAFHAADPFYTVKHADTWFVDVKGVGKLNSDFQTPTHFTNTTSQVIQTSHNFPLNTLIICVFAFAAVCVIVMRKRGRRHSKAV